MSLAELPLLELYPGVLAQHTIAHSSIVQALTLAFPDFALHRTYSTLSEGKTDDSMRAVPKGELQLTR
jgi:hypothetical protein